MVDIVIGGGGQAASWFPLAQIIGTGAIAAVTALAVAIYTSRQASERSVRERIWHRKAAAYSEKRAFSLSTFLTSARWYGKNNEPINSNSADSAMPSDRDARTGAADALRRKGLAADLFGGEVSGRSALGAGRRGDRARGEDPQGPYPFMHDFGRVLPWWRTMRAGWLLDASGRCGSARLVLALGHAASPRSIGGVTQDGDQGRREALDDGRIIRGLE